MTTRDLSLEYTRHWLPEKNTAIHSCTAQFIKYIKKWISSLFPARTSAKSSSLLGTLANNTFNPTRNSSISILLWILISRHLQLDWYQLDLYTHIQTDIHAAIHTYIHTNLLSLYPHTNRYTCNHTYIHPYTSIHTNLPSIPTHNHTEILATIHIYMHTV